MAKSLSQLISHPAHAVAVGISGGADSFSLLHMVLDWAHEHHTKVIALTVDHGLRAENAEEAKRVGEWCETNNIEHHTLVWEGEKPKTAIQDTAREARRELLCTYCKKNNIPVLLLGHHADDQMETILMRLQRGSGLRGLSGIQPETIDKKTGVHIVRPLLGYRRRALRQYALENELPFIDDPSNNNISFERPRVRLAMAQIPDLADGAPLVSSRLTRANDALNQLAQEWVNAHVQKHENGFWFARDAFLKQPEELRLRILQFCMMQTYPDGIIPLDGLEQLCEAMTHDSFAGQTLAGSWVKPKAMEKHPGFTVQPAPERKE